MKTSCETVIYIDWFYLCNMSIRNFITSCISMIKDRHRHLLSNIPAICTECVPHTVNDLLCDDCAELLHYLNGEIADDMDFLHDVHLMQNLHMEVDYELLNVLVAKHTGSKVFVLCPVRSSVLQLISVSYLNKLIVPKVHITENSIRESMQRIADNGNHVLLYTEEGLREFQPKNIE